MYDRQRCESVIKECYSWDPESLSLAMKDLEEKYPLPEAYKQQY
jgi:hypothetical protein